MRKDENIQNAIDLDRAEEKTSGCCIRDDGSGCRQTVQTKCSVSIKILLLFYISGRFGVRNCQTDMK